MLEPLLLRMTRTHSHSDFLGGAGAVFDSSFHESLEVDRSALADA
jgi:hypothetical protein